MFFKKKYLIIFENNFFQIEIENISIFKELGDIIKNYILQELNNKNSDLIVMLNFLKIIKISQEGFVSSPHIMIESNENKINLPISIYFLRKEEKNQIQETFKHEITHLYQRNKTYLIKYFYTKRKQIISKKNIFKLNRISERVDIHDFFYLTIIEGFARYIEGNNLNYNYKNEYNNLKKKLSEIKSEIIYLKKFSYDTLDIGENSLYYDLGKNVIYTIITNTNIPFLELVEMKFKKILELYENIMFKKLNLQPLITYSSEKGILDYRKIILKI